MKLPRLAYNFLSSVGAAIAIIAGLLVAVMLIVSIFTEIENPYLGIFSFLILPAILIFGLVLIPIGMLRRWRREKRGEKIDRPKWPYVDLNIKGHRNAFFIFISGTFFFLVFTAVGSYQAFHFSESVEFCGTTCHSVMEPEPTLSESLLALARWMSLETLSPLHKCVEAMLPPGLRPQAYLLLTALVKHVPQELADPDALEQSITWQVEYTSDGGERVTEEVRGEQVPQ